jgi:fatty acid-binding protein DegV
MVKTGTRIEVVDTMHVIMAEGLIAIQAAIAAKSGTGLDKIVDLAKNAIPRVEERMAFDTLEYLKRGGRIGSAQAFLGSILKIERWRSISTIPGAVPG